MRAGAALLAIIRDLAVPDDFRGRPVALLGNQLGHVFFGMGSAFVLSGLAFGPGLGIALVAVLYAFCKEILIDLRRGASLRDMAADTAFVAMGAAMGFEAMQGDPLGSLILWTAIALAALSAAVAATR